MCRYAIRKPASQLSPCFALIEAMEMRNMADAGVLDVVELLEKIGITGARGLVLDPSTITLNQRITSIGNTGEVWEGTLHGSQKVRVATPWG